MNFEKKKRLSKPAARLYVLGITQRELAQKVGAAEGTISGIFTGKILPSIRLSVSIAEVLEMDERELRAMLLEIAS